jgi:hypothetical protein
MKIIHIEQSLAARTANLVLATMAAAAAVTTSAIPSNAAVVTTGLTLNFDAGLDTNGNNVWESTESLQSYNWVLGSGITRNPSPVTRLPGIAGAYVFPNSGSDLPIAKATAGSYQGISGNFTNNPVSFEIWFKPESLANGNQVLWETGGGVDGSSFTLRNGNTLRFTMRDNNEYLMLETPIASSSEFIQAVATYDRNNPGSTDTLSLYINGVLSGTITGTGVNDWAGGNASGLGGRNGATGGNGAGGVDLNFGTFKGEIALFRLYQSALTKSDVKQNFETIAEVPEPSSALSLLALGLLGVGAAAANRKSSKKDK